LALNLHWSWNHAADELWEALNKDLWASTQNPWFMLHTVSREKIKTALGAPEFRQKLDSLLRKKRDSYQADAWFQHKHPGTGLSTVAYFSMEFMLSEALPIYSGGLGNVAGGQMKAASELCVPVVGVGLLYGQGYFRQDFDSEGRQQALYPVNDPEQLPIRPLRQPNGEWLRLQIQLPGSKIWLRCWEVSVERAKLYLLDTNFIKRPEVQGRAVFLNHYNMMLAQELVQGIDLWINTPRRPWEACGTSGMKVLVNGGLNLSELDGWWAEAYSPEVGWAIGDGQEHGDDPGWDAEEADTLYTLLEAEVIPEFYERDESGMPAKWLGRIRESMARLTLEFSATRAISEYTESHYLPAASRYRDRAADDCALGSSLLQWRLDLDRHWSNVRFVSIRIETHDGQHFFEADVAPVSLTPDQFRVELYADASHGKGSSLEAMNASGLRSDTSGAFTYSAQVSVARPASDYTARIVPHHPNALAPLEAKQIVWQR
jgi:glucan phosphorylase